MFPFKAAQGQRPGRIAAGIVLVLMLALTLTACTAQGGASAGTTGNAVQGPAQPAATAGDAIHGPVQPAADTTTANKDLVIPIADITETAAFYPAEIEGIKLEVIAVKAGDGTIRTAFNTCQVCYDSGRGYYKQEGDQLVCQNCGNRFPMDRVEVQAGGCNPWPIFAENKTVTEESITISYDYLKQATAIFQNWRTEY
jgi:hypothetical protein